MRHLAVVSKLTGVSTNVEASEVTLSTPSIVKLSVSREDISQLTRINQDLVVTLRSGDVITIKNFYVANGSDKSQLVLEDSNGALWWVQDTDGAFHFQHLDDLTPLMAAEGSHDGGAVWPWVLGGVAAAGGIALAAGGGGGGGGGGGDNPGNGNGNGNNPGNGNGNNPGGGNGDGDGGTPPTTPALPGVPVITSVVDNQELITGIVNQQESTNDNTPTLQGAGTANTTLHIFDNGKEIGQVTIDASGNWSFTPSPPLADGTHQFTVSASNSAGSSRMSDSWVIIVDTLAPDAPALSQELDDVGSIQGFIASNAVIDDDTPTLSGIGVAGNFISVYDNGILIGMTQVDENGNWTFTPDTPLSEGVHNLTLTQTDPAGNVSAETTVPTFTVDITPPPAAAITNVTPEGTTVTGSAEPGSTVSIIGSNNLLLGSAVVGQDGTFSIAISPSQTHGESLTAKIHDEAGNVGPDTPFNAQNSGYPGVPVIVSVMDDVAPSTGPLSNNQATNDNKPTLSGTADANSTVNIYDNGVAVDSVQADSNGNWSWTSSSPLDDGPNAFTVTATNQSGTGGVSTAFNINIDTLPPSAPDDLSVSADGAVVTGKTEPGNTVVITDSKNTPIGSGVAGPDGSFTITIKPPQTNGETLTAISTDPAGNSSPPETAVAPDITAPQPPTNLVINGAGNEVTGKAEPDSTVNILDPRGNIIGTTTATADGDFTAALVPPQTNGEILTANATDAAGNKGGNASVTAPDTTAPDAPTDVIVAGNGGSVSGHAEAGSTVTVKDSDGHIIGKGQADSGGNFTVSIAPAQINSETVTVTATDGKGNESLPTSAIAPDLTAPEQPIIIAVTDDVADYTGRIDDNGLTNDDKPKIEGTAEANSQVKIYDNGNLLATVTADLNGNWSYTPTTALAQGAHVFTVTATDAASNTSSATSWKIIVDSIAPTVPAITLINDDVGSIAGNVANNGVTNDKTPTFSGTGEPGSLVTLYDNGLQMRVILIDRTGTWSHSVPANEALSEGTHRFTLTATDAAGNVVTAPPVIITVDTKAPDAPIISSATDDVGSLQSDLANGGRSDDTLPLLKGTGVADSTITIYDGATPIGTATVTPEGSWSFQVTQPLSEGPHALSAIATDKAGNASSVGNFTLTIDTTPPAAPVITSAEGLIGSETKPLANGGSTKSDNPKLSGTGEPGATITVFDNDVRLGTATVQPNGTWTFTPTLLTDGPHKFTVTATDVAGNTGIPSAGFTLTVDNLPPAKPEPPTITDDVNPITGIITNGITNDTTPTFSGTGSAGDVIAIYLDGRTEPLGTATVGADGTWSFTPTDPINPDSYQVTLTATDPAGNVSPRSDAVTLGIDTTPSAPPVITAVNDDVGDVRGDLAADAVTDDTTPTIRGTGSNGDIITLYNGSTVIGTATVAGGVWSITPNPALTNGSYTLTAIATDAAGNASDASNSVSFTVNSTPLIVTSIEDDHGVITGLLSTGSATDDSSPAISGTGIAGSTVYIYSNGLPDAIAFVQVGVDGSWSINVPLNEGGNTLTFVAKDSNGNSISIASPITLNLDTQAPNAPLITLIDADGTRVSGTAEPGSTVIISSGSTILGSATANALTGQFTVTLSPAQTSGASLTAIAQDPAGNQSDETSFLASNSGQPIPPTLEIVDDVAPVMGVIGSGKTTNDTLPLLQGTATPGATVNIYQNGTLLDTVTADATSGAWSYQLSTPLTNGTAYNFTVSQTVGGAESGQSPNYTITIDTVPPLAPTIASIIDDVTPGTGTLDKGQLTNDSRPTFNGTGEPGATITLYDGNGVYATTTVNSSGFWSYTPTNALGEGPHDFTVRATDAAGNQGAASDSFRIIVDTLVPDAPSIVTVKDNVGTDQMLTSGQSTNDNTPTLEGVTEANSVVTILDKGTVIGTTTSDADGNWSFTPAPALGEGNHALTATVTDGAGNISPATPPFLLVVDTLPPAAPIITSVIDDQPGNTSLTNGQLTNDALPTLNGKGEAGATITIKDKGVELGTARVDESGNWTFTPENALGQGQHVFTATATDQAGNTGGASSAFTLELDSVAPQAPVISNVQDNTAPTTGPIGNGQTTNETRPALSGTGEIGVTITILSDGLPIGTTTVGAGGTWSFTPTDALSNGPHTLTATATDSAGNTSPASSGFTFTVDTVSPNTPVITQVSDDVGPLTGNLNNGQATNDARPTLNGTAEANSTVKIYDNGTLIDTVSADGSGVWNFTPGSALGNGNHVLTVTSTDAAGNVSVSSAGFALIVDTVAPLAPTIIQAFDDVQPGTGTLSSGAWTNDTRPVLSGSAEANARIAIYDNGTLLTTVTATIDGTWEFLSTTLGNGQHVFTAIATDAAGNVGPASSGFILNVDTVAPSTPILTSVVDDITGGVFNAALSNGQLTNDARPTLNGTAEAGSTVNIYDGSTLLGTALVQSNNSWSFTPTTPLGNGSHTFTVTATDPAGNTSGATAGFTINVDTIAPTLPSISSIVDDVGPNTGSIGNNPPTNDALPTLNGTSEANARIDIYDNGNFVTSVTADGSGNWNYTPSTALGQGPHSFTITATDSAGNTSGMSAAASIVVDTVAPGIPTALAVNANGTVLTGVAEANSTVIVTTSSGTVLGTATANAAGNFTFTLNPPQISGQTLLVSAQDAAGNTGTPGNALAPFTGVPPAPVISSVFDDIGTVTGNVAAGKTTNDTRPMLSGTAQANAVVSLYNNGTLMGTTTADGNGLWSFTPSGALSEGNHAFTASAANANGSGVLSGAFNVIVDTTPPPPPSVLISADGGTVSGIAEAGSTVTISLPGGGSITAVANSSGVYSITLPVRQIEGQSLSATATDAAGNTSTPTSILAPVLPLLAEDNVTRLALQTDFTVTNEHKSDYGFLLVGAVDNVLKVLGDNTALVNFNIQTGGSGTITINAAATGIVLSLLSTMEIVIQRFDSTRNAWVTVVDTGKADFADLLTLSASGVTLNYGGLTGGDYRVVSYNTSLLATGAFTSLDVAVVKTSAGTITGGMTESGNIITDIDPTNGQDNAPSGTRVTSITDGNGNVVNIPLSGADVQGKYGTLHINQDGSYTYTLTNKNASVYGRSESFTYTLTHGNDHSSAKLVVALGQGPTTSTVTAADDVASLTYGTEVSAVDHGPSKQTGFTLASVGLGNVLDVSLVNGLTNPIKFNVEDGATRTLTIQADVLGVTLGGFDLYVYRFNDAIQQYEQYRVQPNWVTAVLGGKSKDYTITLPGGDYLFLLNAGGGLALLTSYTLNIQADHTYAVDSLSASTNGNILANDSAPAGTVITDVNGVAVNLTGTTRIEGQYGTLTIDAKGNYSYTLKSGLGADSINTPDSFVYTVKAPNGDTGSASLNIKPTPLALDAVNDTSSQMAVTTLQDTSQPFSDTSVGSASWTTVLGPSSKSGTGTVEVAAGTAVQNVVLHFNVASGLTLGGLNVTWALYDSNGVKVAGDTFNGGLLIGGNLDIALNGLVLHAGNYRLDYTGNAGALGLGTITITPSVKGTIVDLDNFETAGVNSVTGNIYDGDHIASVHTLLTVNGAGGSTATLDPLGSSTASATINGLYGKLTMGIDGHYTYILNSDVSLESIKTKETFSYTLNDQKGHTDSATLTIDMNPQVISTAEADRVIGSAYGDTLIYHLLSANNATGGNGTADTWSNFSLAQGDKIDIGDLLVGWNGQNATLGNYLTVSTSGNNTVVSIDRDGTGATYQSTSLVTLENVHTTLDELIQQNHIVT
ncbi:large repetitive protein [Citrobacter werkmanii]|uniref:BapA/Bap/LapF family large adhesin n=1 Tax=Citrobacter sp. wls711 TaxID=2576425 RepID=UPI000BBD1DE9|nr:MULTISPECIES: BapA/Bap/LapF family large adhesin [Citrobacter]ATF48494.1 large repetitive protein [Citrobacter werkmanii]TKU60820.1 BapA prefix-like domain-containing protein [Citrobacter sp. wls711]HEE0108121.1 BapA prefix-like domain-containing protein [Citrobacter gillenii]